MEVKSIKDVVRLPWVGSGHPIHKMELHDLDGRDSGIIQGHLAGVGIMSQAIEKGPRGNYVVSVEGSEADRLEQMKHARDIH